MVDIIGPADAVGAVTTRPAETRSFSSVDSWFRDCSSPDLDDGTEYDAAFMNGITALLRTAVRMNGSLISSPGTMVVAEVGTDDGLLSKAIRQLVQRAQPSYGVDTGAANAVVATLSPVPLEYIAGMIVRVKIAATNTGATTINVNGLGVKAIVRFDGTPMQVGDIPAGMIAHLEYDGVSFQLLNPSVAVSRLTYSPTLYVRADGNDANDGALNSPSRAFLTIQAALDRALTQFTLGGKTLTIQIGIPGTYTQFIANPAIGTVSILGDTNSPDGYVIAGPGTGTGNYVVGASGCQITLDGVRIHNTGTVNATIGAVGGGVLIVGNVNFSSATTLGAAVVFAGAGGVIGFGKTAKVRSSAAEYLYAANGGQIGFAGPANTVYEGTLTFSDVVVRADNLSVIIPGPWSMTNVVFGTRYAADMNGVIVVYGGGNGAIPGSAFGSVTTGGQYA